MNSVLSLLNAALSSEVSTRSTGRTSRLLASMSSGDRLVILPKGRPTIQALLPPDKTIIVVEVDPTSPSALASIRGRTYFDHAWLESFFSCVLSEAKQALNHITGEAK